MRGEAALMTCPNDELVKLPFTELAPSNCAWLNVLKVSSRNSRDLDSVNGIVFNRARSQLSIPGPS